MLLASSAVETGWPYRLLLDNNNHNDDNDNDNDDDNDNLSLIHI